MSFGSLLSPGPPRLTAPVLASPLASDERLARLASRGDETAFRELYKRYHQPLYRYCRSLLRNDADAEDALQCTFVAALQSLGRKWRDVPVRPWLFRIAHNESISLIRRRRPEQQLTDGCEAGTDPLEDQVVGRERLELLVADLLALCERQRAALVMRELSDLSHRDIAVALGITVDAAKQAIFEARRSLHEFTEGRAMDCEEVQRVISDADGRMLRSRRVRAHARHCSQCATFAAAIPGRSRQLQALAPGLPPAAAAGLLARSALGGPLGAGDAVGIAAGAGKTLGAGMGLVTKASAIIAATVIAAVGTSIQLQHPAHQSRRGGAITAVRPKRGVSGPGASRGYGVGTAQTGSSPEAVTTREQTGRARGQDGGREGDTTGPKSRSAGHTGKPSSAPRSQTGQASNGQRSNSSAQGAGGSGGGQGSDAQDAGGSGGGQGSDAQGAGGSGGGQGSDGDAQTGSSDNGVQASSNAATQGLSTNRPSSSGQPVASTVAANAGSSPPQANTVAASDGNSQGDGSGACQGSNPGCSGSGNSGN